MNSRALTNAAAALTCLWGIALATALRADTTAKNPTSKFYVADLNGEAQVDTGSEIDDLTKKSVYNAQGTIVETKAKSDYAMVYSNGTGIYFDPSTKVHVNKFQQEPFKPNRLDMDVEPSISQTNAHIDHGIVGLCTSKLVAGSNMTYSTPQGSVNIQGRKVVIEVTNNKTVVSMIEGDSTVQGGDADAGGHGLHDGQQAIITPAGLGQPASIKIQDIPADQKSALADRVTAACLARKTVYFEVASKAGGFGSAAGSTTVTAFDGAAVNGNPSGVSAGSDQQIIVAVPVIPAVSPTTNVVSASILTAH